MRFGNLALQPAWIRGHFGSRDERMLVPWLRLLLFIIFSCNCCGSSLLDKEWSPVLPAAGLPVLYTRYHTWYQVLSFVFFSFSSCSFTQHALSSFVSLPDCSVHPRLSPGVSDS